GQSQKHGMKRRPQKAAHNNTQNTKNQYKPPTPGKKKNKQLINKNNAANQLVRRKCLFLYKKKTTHPQKHITSVFLSATLVFFLTLSGQN
ncbi:hypothetical protein ACQWF5_24325, partial [Salmonella enterica subsp. enterica serovar Infantis]